MTLDTIDVETTLKEVHALLAKEPSLSPALRAALKVLLLLVTALLNRLNLNSRNSSKPPLTDPNRPRTGKGKSERKPGGQHGHVGATLEPVDDPDEVRVLSVDRSVLPEGQYQAVGFEARQVFDLDISLVVTEYRAEILKDARGQTFTAPFPEGVNRRVQYGNGLKAHAVYLSQYQLLPYHRIEEYFRAQLQIPLSSGSLFNFNQEAFERLAAFETSVRERLAESSLLHADETGINIDGQRQWLHGASNDQWTFFYPHAKRGTEAMDAMGILPRFGGILCHDHWKSYFRYDCLHALCNAHHLRELERAFEQDAQAWAKSMQALLIEGNQAVIEAGGQLNAHRANAFRKRYRQVLATADAECPPPNATPPPGHRGRLKRSKARNLLERLRDFENEVLRFMTTREVPFTNNQGENDIRRGVAIYVLENMAFHHAYPGGTFDGNLILSCIRNAGQDDRLWITLADVPAYSISRLCRLASPIEQITRAATARALLGLLPHLIFSETPHKDSAPRGAGHSRGFRPLIVRGRYGSG